MNLPIAVLLLTSSTALASIPDFTTANAPEAVKSDPNPKAKEFWRELVEHSKREGRKMFTDTQATTGLKPSDMKRKDWDCLFWRVAATFAKQVRRQNPGLQPPAFADQVEKTSLDDDCPDEGGPGSFGVQVYNTAINRVMGSRGGWQKSQSTAPIPVPSRETAPAHARVSSSMMRAFLAAGVVIGDAAKGAAVAAGGVLPLLVLPQGMVDDLMTGQKKGHQPL